MDIHEIHTIEKRTDKTVIIFLGILLLLGMTVMIASDRYAKNHYQELINMQ
jgi:nitrate reductase gamma subunit